jgi:nicotinamidase-related amidase
MDDDARRIYAERGVGGRQRAGSRPCLVVVDLSYGFTDPESSLGCDADGALEANARLLAVAREGGVPVIYTRIEYDDESREIAAAFLEKLPGLAALTPGSRWARIDDAIAPQPGEPVLVKLFASGFFGTPLASFLAARGCDSVVITGASTSGCVRATVVDALQHGYRVVVPREAVADRARAPHEAALFDIDAKYGQVVGLDEAEALLRAAARQQTTTEASA